MTLRGKIVENAPLGEKGWFKCGGTAEKFFKPADLEDLQGFIQDYDRPVHIFGALSNTIIRDGGLSGVTIRLGRDFSEIKALSDFRIKVGALALDANVSKVAADNGIGGLEFLSGIPGTIGGALRMNAGCYGREVKDVLVECDVMDAAGGIHTLKPDDMGLGYRHNSLPAESIFLNATLIGEGGASEAIHKKIEEIKQKREESQPLREKTGGSTFANPTMDDLAIGGLPPNTKVWELIDQIGGRGLSLGGAKMSEKHCNFMINQDNATATDLEKLGEEIRRRVHETFGIKLRWEIKILGNIPKDVGE